MQADGKVAMTVLKRAADLVVKTAVEMVEKKVSPQVD